MADALWDSIEAPHRETVMGELVRLICGMCCWRLNIKPPIQNVAKRKRQP